MCVMGILLKGVLEPGDPCPQGRAGCGWADRMHREALGPAALGQLPSKELLEEKTKITKSPQISFYKFFSFFFFF